MVYQVVARVFLGGCYGVARQLLCCYGIARQLNIILGVSYANFRWLLWYPMWLIGCCCAVAILSQVVARMMIGVAMLSQVVSVVLLGSSCDIRNCC